MNKSTFPFLLLVVVLTFLVRDNPFFWDTVQLASRHAHWYYENDFAYFFLPAEMDSGHPPYFGMGLAALWKIVGRELWVGHLYMLPFLLGIVLLLDQLGRYFLNGFKSWWLILPVLVDPVFAGQSVLVTPDIVLLFFFLLSLLGILKDKPWVLVFATIGMAAISTRGMMVTFALFLFQLFRHWQIDRTTFDVKLMVQILLPYVPSGLFALGFLWAHYEHSGWIGYHADSPWAPSFERVGISGMLKNIGLLTWRMLDFGRVVLWIVALYIGIRSWRRGLSMEVKTKELIALGIVLILVTTPSMILHRYLSAHRYLLPIMLVFDMLTVVLIVRYFANTAWKNFMYALVILALITGNQWVYPKTVAQGWDATLAHYPYYQLREQMLNYIDTEGIPYESIGTDFPNYAARKIIDLNQEERSLAHKNLAENEYIFYSTVYNNFTDEELTELETNWVIVQRFANLQIEVVLFKKRS